MAPAGQNASTKDAISGLVGLGVVVAALYFMGVIDFGSETTPAGSPPAATAPEPRRSTIKVTIDDFRSGMPFLVDEGVSQEKRSDGTHYIWKARPGSVAAAGSWIRFLDAESDGSLDEVKTALVFPEDKAAQLAAIGTAYRLVEIASGGHVEASSFSSWLVKSPERLAQTRQTSLTRVFGQVSVRLSILRIDGIAGACILLTMK